MAPVRNGSGLVTVKVAGALVWPTGTPPNRNVSGAMVRTMMVGAVPVPARLTVVLATVEERSLAVTVSVAGRGPVACGGRLRRKGQLAPGAMAMAATQVPGLKV